MCQCLAECRVCRHASFLPPKPLCVWHIALRQSITDCTTAGRPPSLLTSWNPIKPVAKIALGAIPLHTADWWRPGCVSSPLRQERATTRDHATYPPLSWGLYMYRASHALGDWVLLTCMSSVPLSAWLLGLMEIWQNWLGSWARWCNTEIQVKPTLVLQAHGTPCTLPGCTRV